MGQYFASTLRLGAYYKPSPFPNDSGDGKYFTSLLYFAPVNGDAASLDLVEGNDSVVGTVLTGYTLAGALTEAGDSVLGTILTGYVLAGTLNEANDNVAVALALAGSLSVAFVEANDSFAGVVLTGFTMALSIAEAGDSISGHLHGDTDAPVIDPKYLIVAPHRIRTITPS